MRRSSQPGFPAPLFRGGDQGKVRNQHSQRKVGEGCRVTCRERREGSGVWGDDESGGQEVGGTWLSRMTFSLDDGHKYVLSGRPPLWAAQINPVSLSPVLASPPMATACWRLGILLPISPWSSASPSWGILSILLLTPGQILPWLFLPGNTKGSGLNTPW